MTISKVNDVISQVHYDTIAEEYKKSREWPYRLHIE